MHYEMGKGMVINMGEQSFGEQIPEEQKIENPNSDMDYSSQQNQYPYMQENVATDKNKNSTTLIVAAAIILAIMAAVVLAVVMVFLIFSNVKVSTVKEIINEEFGMEEVVPDDSGEENPLENPDSAQEAGQEDPFLAKDYVNGWGTNHENHTADEFTGEFYEKICECIDDSVDYQIHREFYSYTSETGTDTIQVAYYQLEGNIPNLEELNENMKQYSAYMAGNYFGNYPEGQEYEGTMQLLTDSYVTYNDEQKMSIVLDEHWAIDTTAGFDLYGLNIDLQNGVIMENDKILDIDDTFVTKFKERNHIQNEADGEVPVVSQATNQQLIDELSDAATNIIFYTPVGMEVGFNYSSEKYNGWVTVSFKDYQQYLKSF